MSKRMPPEVLEYLRKLGRAYGSQGGKKAAKNMTAAERSARAKKAATAAAKKRTAKRLAREASAERGKKAERYLGSVVRGGVSAETALHQARAKPGAGCSDTAALVPAQRWRSR